MNTCKRLPNMDYVQFSVFPSEEMLYLHSCDDEHGGARVRTTSKHTIYKRNKGLRYSRANKRRLIRRVR